MSHTYSEVRSAVNSLLSLAEQEHNLEQGNSQSDPFDDSRRIGILAFTLASICHTVPGAYDRLKKQMNEKARFVGILSADNNRRSNEQIQR
jgi:hypothetical protein